MHVVVTGGTGLVGRRLVRRLLGAGHDVTVLTRDPERAAGTLPARCRTAPWDPATGRLAPVVLAGAGAVVHLAGEGVADGRWTPSRKAAILGSRVDGTRVLVDAFAALPPDERPRALIAASAIGVYGDRGDEVLTERSDAGPGFLADVCQVWEAETFAAERLDVRTVAVRIGIVLAPEGGALARMLPPVRLGVGGRLGSGRQWMSWIHVDDLVELLAFALGRDDVRGVLAGVAPAPVTNTAFTRALGRVLGRPTLLPVPGAALRLLLGEMAVVVLASQRVLPERVEAVGFRFRYGALDAALADLTRDPASVLEREQWLPRPPEEVFAFFSDAHNLEAITPPFLRFRVLRVSTPEIRAGTRIDYRLVLHGVPIRWQTRIDAWEPARAFVDSQARGPYKVWHHTHEFEACDGGTLVRDRVRYELPFGAMGALVAAGFVARDVAAIFAYRRARIAERFGAPHPRAAGAGA